MKFFESAGKSAEWHGVEHSPWWFGRSDGLDFHLCAEETKKIKSVQEVTAVKHDVSLCYLLDLSLESPVVGGVGGDKGASGAPGHVQVLVDRLTRSKKVST